MEEVTDFIFLDSKITADNDCSHEIERHLLLGRKSMTNLDNILKSRDITLPTRGPYSQSYGFSSSHVWMWELTVMKTECQRTDAFELWCWRKFFRVPWLSRRSILKEILKEINPEYPLEWLSILNTWCEEPTDWKRPWCWKRLQSRKKCGRGWDS